MNATHSVRTATKSDLRSVAELANLSPDAPHWTLKQYEEIFSASSESGLGRTLFVAERGSELLGFCLVNLVAGEAEIESIVIAATKRRLGLGATLCRHAFGWLSARSVAEVWLEVRKSNLAAQSLYRSVGFDEVGRRAAYYSLPTEDAVLMRASLAGASHL